MVDVNFSILFLISIFFSSPILLESFRFPFVWLKSLFSVFNLGFSNLFSLLLIISSLISSFCSVFIFKDLLKDSIELLEFSSSEFNKLWYNSNLSSLWFLSVSITSSFGSEFILRIFSSFSIFLFEISSFEFNKSYLSLFSLIGKLSSTHFRNKFSFNLFPSGVNFCK